METKTYLQGSLDPEHKRIRVLRRQLEVSQLEVATQAGISQSQFSLYEQGYVRLDSDVTGRINDFLNTTAFETNNTINTGRPVSGQ